MKFAHYLKKQADELGELLRMPTILNPDPKTASEEERQLIENRERQEREYQEFLNLKY